MILQDPLNLRVLRCTAAQPSLQVFKVKRKLPMTKVMKQFCKLSGLKFEVRQMATIDLRLILIIIHYHLQNRTFDSSVMLMVFLKYHFTKLIEPQFE